jgi:hypothetical protein
MAGADFSVCETAYDFAAIRLKDKNLLLLTTITLIV